MITKNKLVFDPTDLEIDNVGAYLRSGAGGALISHHSPVEAGDVTFTFVDGDVTVGSDSIAEVGHGLMTGDVVQLSTTGTLPAPLATATDYYVIRVDDDNFQLALTPADAEQGNPIDITSAAGGGTHTLTEQEVERKALDVWVMNEISINDGGNAISIDDGGGSITVDATNLDIRDLTQADEITVFQGTSPWVVGDGGGSLTVDATQLDIDDLNATDDAVQAWLRDGAGNAISSTGGALDVNITNDITVDMDGVYNVGTNPDPDNVGMIGHVRNASPGDAQQTLRWTGAAPSADNVDPANSLAMDVNSFLMGWDGSAWDRATITSGALNVNFAPAIADDAADSGNPLKVGSRAVSGVLTALSASNDRADLLSDLYRRIWINDSMNIGIASAAVTVTDSQVNLASSPLGGRRKIMVQNLGTRDIAVGPSGLSYASGIKIPRGNTMELNLGPDVSLFAIADTGNSVSVNVFQGA